MTATSPVAARHGRTRISLWVCVAALVVGSVVAVLGVGAGIASYQRDQAIHHYSDARSAAVYFVKSGDTVSALMQRLQTLNEQDVSLMVAQRAALAADNTSEFNSLAKLANNQTAQQQSLHNLALTYQKAFEAALR